MSFFSCSGKHKKKYHKFAIVEVFRAKPPFKQSVVPEIEEINKYAEQLAKNSVSYQSIKKLAWNGVPQCLRPKIWKYLLKYALINGGEDILSKKRDEYMTYVKNYWKPDNFGEEQKIYNTIEGDVKRIGADFNSMFKWPVIQKMLKRLLFIWHIRHPASGYVQGMCDLTNPFVIVYLSQYLPLNQTAMKFEAPIDKLDQTTISAVEADVYWSVSKMLESVVSNYTQGFGGMQKAYSRVQQLLFNIDQQLYEHFIKEKIDLFSLSFRNISTMLLRSFDPLVGIRLFDTYISYYQQYPTLMIFLLIALLQKFAEKMLKMRFDELMVFVNNLPTKEWTQNDLTLLVAQAYVYKEIFDKKIK